MLIQPLFGKSECVINSENNRVVVMFAGIPLQTTWEKFKSQLTVQYTNPKWKIHFPHCIYLILSLAHPALDLVFQRAIWIYKAMLDFLHEPLAAVVQCYFTLPRFCSHCADCMLFWGNRQNDTIEVASTVYNMCILFLCCPLRLRELIPP